MAYVQYSQPIGQPAWGAGQMPGYPGALAAPAFQPQPTWGGLDFYRAHAPSNYNDPSLFNHAWDRVRQFDAATAGGLGVGIHEAKHWHRRAYGGMPELAHLGPAEVGHAAAYEAYRNWVRNQSMYDTLGPDIERQREGLIGLAVAEAGRLLSFAGRSMDHYARSAASDAAAHTASYIFYQRRRDDEYYHHRGRSRSRGRYDPEWDELDEPYRYEDDHETLDPYHRGRSRSRHRSRSRPRSYSAHAHMPYEGTPYPGTPGGFPPLGGAPSYAGSHGGGPLPPLGVPYASSGGGIPPPPPLTSGGYSSGYSTSGYYPPPNSGYGPQGGYGSYGGAYPAPGMPMAVPLGHAASNSSGYSYGSQPYSTTGSVVGAPTAGVPPQTIVIHKSRRHKHRHRSRSRAGSE
ncbi:hypothetical protein CC1G_14216 [Coprinopsis cinerea okayama7|uniref:Uncharacterized protein n=1 Tax=Coprinopsis cinerea (strain Okayama-7 / 130 / ATCC MYA-4618 / FGSC 9003) TaxID=240176 RepID=D6RL81_COPC7|nr:hypothetical protein CC1G_14216 [Coprinopsis cinerea okayama7\|eukprot:XP_002911683.1 hypothetical protein CC1G_14216 [Coprinopsis cinerea okayama7\